MGVLAKILGAHGANVAATLAAVYLCGRTALPARWLSGISVYRAGAATTNDSTKKRPDDGTSESEGGGGGDEILLGGAEAVAQLRLTPAAVAQSAFFDEWSALTTALAVLLANAAADSLKASTRALSPSISTSTSTSAAAAAALWKGTLYSSLWAIVTALYTLIKVEVDQARVLSSWAHLRESAVVAAGASVAALLLLLSPSSDLSAASAASSSSSSSPLLLPPLDLAAGGRAAARLLYVATEIEVETLPKALIALPLAVVAGALVPLLAGSAARGARAVSLSAARPPRWGREMLRAEGPRDRAALRCAALVAPLAAALLWLEPCARLWVGAPAPGGEAGGDGSAAAAAAAASSLRSLSLLFAALASVLAARPSVAAHCGTALVVWWTRKHGFVSRRAGKESGNGNGGGRTGGGGGTGGGGEEAGKASTAAAAAAAVTLARRGRAGEVLRLSMQFINLFALKAGVQALGPGALWLGCGAVSLAAGLEARAAPGGGGGSGSGSGEQQVALWLGGWSAAAFSLCSLWHLTLYWCGWLNDVPSGGKR